MMHFEADSDLVVADSTDTVKFGVGFDAVGG